MADPSQPAPDQFDTMLQGLMTPAKPTGLADKASAVFAHPLVQAALGAYLGGITTPRYEGIGGALGRGGLIGLQDFNQARQLQLQQPLMRTQMLKNIVGAKKDIAQAGEAEARGGMIKAEYGTDPDLAAHMDVLAQNTQDPATAMVYGALAHGLRSGMKKEDAQKTLLSLAEEGPKIALQKAQTQLAKATTGLRMEQAAEAPQLAAAKIGQEQAGATRSLAGAAAEPGKAANAQIAKVNTDLGRFLTTNPGGDHDLQVQRAVAYAQNLNPDVSPDQIKAAAEALIPPTGMMTKVGESLGFVPGPKTGAGHNVITPAHGPNPTATGPDGRRIRWDGKKWAPVGGAPDTMPGTAIAGE